MPPKPPGIPIPVSTHNETRAATGRILTRAEEERLAGVFTFLASASNDPRKVSALCLEESSDPSVLTIKLAANHGGLIQTKLHFEDVAQILKAVHERKLHLPLLCRDSIVLRSLHV